MTSPTRPQEERPYPDHWERLAELQVFRAPHAAWDTVHLYVDVPDAEALGEVARQAGWETGPGKLVLMRPWYAHSAWVGMRSVHGLPVVSDLQLVLDLWNYPVRGREQADVLMAKMDRKIEATRKEAQ